MPKDKEIFGRLDAKLPGLKVKGLLRKDIVKIVGVVGRTIQHYTDIGLVVPEGPLSGKGTKRRYSKQNIFEMLLVQVLIGHGFKLSDVKPIINTASKQWIKSPNLKTLMINTFKGSSSKKYDVQLYGESCVDLKIDLNGSESILIIDISDVIEKIKTI